MISFEQSSAFILSLVLSQLYHSMGGTLGYHRILSHKSLKVPKWLEYLIVSGGYLGLEGSPIFWVSTHRRHHRYSDIKEQDPHTPLDGFWHSFIAWMWSPKTQMTKEESQKLVPDLYRDPLYRLLHCKHTHWDGFLCLALCILFRIAIFYIFGLWVLLGNLIGTILAFCGPLLVNSVCHLPRFGYQTYKNVDQSRNVWFVALLTHGEGWHNNHHAFPQSARHGLKPHEVDATWITIKMLEKLGLTNSIRLPRNEDPEQKIEPVENELEMSFKP